MNSWTKENYPKLLAIGLGMTAAFSLSYYLYTNYFRDDGKINKQDIVQHYAKRLKSKMEETKTSGVTDWAKFIMNVHDTCNPELDALDHEYQQKLSEAKLRDLEYFIKLECEYLEKKNEIIDEAEKFIRSKSPLVEGGFPDLDVEHLLESLRHAGAQVNPLFTDYLLFETVLIESVESEEKFKAENPDVRAKTGQLRTC
jgi:hypothetical protein